MHAVFEFEKYLIVGINAKQTKGESYNDNRGRLIPTYWHYIV